MLTFFRLRADVKLLMNLSFIVHPVELVGWGFIYQKHIELKDFLVLSSLVVFVHLSMGAHNEPPNTCTFKM